MSYSMIGVLINFTISIWTMYQIVVALSAAGVLWPVLGASLIGAAAVGIGAYIDKKRWTALAQRFDTRFNRARSAN